MTDYIKRVFPFTRPPMRTTRAVRYGISFGRKFHSDVYAVLKQRQTLTKPKPKATLRSRTLYYYFDFLRRVNLTPHIAEVPIYSCLVNIATKIDLVCTLPDGTVVLVENKTTRHTYDNYMRTYKTTMAAKPLLVNGLPNNEYTQHQLQIGASVAMCADVRTKHPVRGVVIVCCADKFGLFWTPSTLADASLYPRVLT